MNGAPACTVLRLMMSTALPAANAVVSLAKSADRSPEVLNVVFAKLRETGKWVKANPKDAATLLAGLWSIDAATVEEANGHRSYGVGAVTPAGLTEQQKIADAFLGEGLIPKKLDTAAVRIWTPQAP